MIFASKSRIDEGMRDREKLIFDKVTIGIRWRMKGREWSYGIDEYSFRISQDENGLAMINYRHGIIEKDEKNLIKGWWQGSTTSHMSDYDSPGAVLDGLKVSMVIKKMDFYRIPVWVAEDKASDLVLLAEVSAGIEWTENSVVNHRPTLEGPT